MSKSLSIKKNRKQVIIINVEEFAKTYLGEEGKDYINTGKQITLKHCPYCAGGDREEEKTFSINIETGAFYCHRQNQCGETGSFNKLLAKYGVKLKVYNDVELKELTSKKLIDYLSSRSISLETAKHAKVRQLDKDTLAFPIFYDYKNVGIKYRRLTKDGKHCWKEKDGKDAFIGQIKSNEDLIIVEGEMDYLAVLESGHNNVISLPLGAGIGNKLNCITYDWEKLKNVKSIILWVDNDKAGHETKDELIRRLGVEKCWLINTTYKDANEALMFEGKDYVMNLIYSKVRPPVPGLISLARAKEFNPKDVKSIKTGLADIDKLTGGLIMNQVSVWTGKNGSGKSSLLNNIVAEAIEQDYNTFIYSAELDEGVAQYWLELPIAGRENIIEENGRFFIKEDVKEKIKKWYDFKVIFAYPEFARTPRDLLQKMEEAYKMYGTKFFIVDNLMSLYFGTHVQDMLEKEREFVQDCVNFAKKYSVHVAIVTHPTKTNEKITKDNVRGTGHITNIAHAVYLLHRTQNELKEEIKLEIAKNRLYGKLGEVELNFCEASKRFNGENDNPDKKYGW